MKLSFLAAVMLTAAATHAANITVSPWTPVFKGVDYATGYQEAVSGGERHQRVNCMRIDLTDPDVEIMPTPRCTNCGVFETAAENTSRFLEQNGLQVAMNCNFYASSSGGNDPALGTPENVFGLAISRGQIVSPATDSTHQMSLLISSNREAIFAPGNASSISTEGIQAAVSGNFLLVNEGVNVGLNDLNDVTDPRSAVGLSQDKRYVYFMTIDGRQPAWSGGANFFETAAWLLRFGAWNAFNVDGGGSTTMSMSDCQGKAVRINRPSYLLLTTPPRERIVGHNVGVYAKSLPSAIKELTVTPGPTTAIVTWKTDFDATTLAEYGLDTNYTGSTVPDLTPTRTHIVTLTGLQPGSNYFFRAVSTTGVEQYTNACQFSTLALINRTLAFDITNSWKYTTNNLDGVNWKARAYDDSAWLGPGPGLLHIEDRAAVSPRNTLLPPGVPPGVVPAGSQMPRTFYFRTHFSFSGPTNGLSMIFSNYIDDGAVFYLNGTEIQRLRMAAAPTQILNATAAQGSPCSGTSNAGEAATNCPDVFTLSGSVLTNLVQGDNVLSVEVHNGSSGTDIVFGSALIINGPGSFTPTLNLHMSDNRATLYWNGDGFTLQGATDLSTAWTNVTPAATTSPVVITNSGTTLYRLQK